MLRIRKSKKGFTLIELMIVVAIIGILAAIAIPKFADLIRKSKEASTKGSLGAIRASVVIYYGDNEGMLPPSLGDLIGAQTAAGQSKYLDALPTVKLGLPVAHPVDLDTEVAVAADGGNWCYTSGDGKVTVSCTCLDTKGNVINTW